MPTYRNAKDGQEQQVRRDPGRPPDDPYFKAGIPLRALFSKATINVLVKSRQKRKMKWSNYLRYAIWCLIKEDGLSDEIDLEKDNTWKELKELGFLR